MTFWPKNWIHSPFNFPTFAQPYLERTFTSNSSLSQLSLVCCRPLFKRISLGQKTGLTQLFLVYITCTPGNVIPPYPSPSPMVNLYHLSSVNPLDD